MAQYISKSALVAEIENNKKYAQTLGDSAINSSMQQFYDGMKQGCVNILSFINTLEVKEVELSWEDISAIISIDQQVCGKMGIRDYVHNHQKAMEEVLKRFKAQKGG